MSTIAVTMVKNEQDIVGPIIEHMVGQVDHVIVADNMSTDNTRAILNDFGDSITIVEDNDPAYEQSKKMSALAQRALLFGAEWVVPFDADEYWYSPHYDTISECLSRLPQYRIAEAKLYNHYATDKDIIDNNPLKSIGYRFREPGALPKVAVRAAGDLVIHMGNHGAEYTNDPSVTPNRVYDQLIVRHFPYRTPEQFIQKVRQGAEALRQAQLPETAGQHWRNYAQILDQQGPDAIYAVYYQWFHFDDPDSNPELIYDPCITP